MVRGCSPELEVLLCADSARKLIWVSLSGGVMVAQGPLEAFVMVRIHAGQPNSPLRRQLHQPSHQVKKT